MASEAQMTFPEQDSTTGAPKKVHLTTSEAAELTGYSPDHIGLLLRRGRLSGEKRGRDWFITTESIEAYVNNKPAVGRPKS